MVFFLKEIQRIGVIMSSFAIVSSHLQWLSTDSLSGKYVWVKFVERAFAKVGRVSCLICEKKFLVDPGRIRTCNPLIRSQMPYPLGHRANVGEVAKIHWRHGIITNFAQILLPSNCQCQFGPRAKRHRRDSNSRSPVY